MKIWAIADLHLSFGIPDKSMEIFGEQWKNWTDKIQKNWQENVFPNDLVLIPGDICWAKKIEEAKQSLEWIHSLPGIKLLIKGNHDYWWSSYSKVKNILPPSLYILQNDAFSWGGYSIAGARLWDSQEFSFGEYIAGDIEEKKEEDRQQDEKIFQRELIRLEMSLKNLDPKAKKIVMTHYPPIGSDLCDSSVSKMLEKYDVECAVFGHLHSLKKGISYFGEKNGIKYQLASCDYLNFMPLRLF